MKTINLKNPGVIIFCHSLFVLAVYILANAFLKGYPIPDNANLMHYDVFYYYTIKRIGYLYLQGKANNLAFFPLFPYVWGLTTLNALFMGLLNYLIFALSFYFLIKNDELPASIILLIISIPSFIFFAIPYAESLFFFFCTLIINGYKKQSTLLLCLGFFGASIVRSVCVIFIPAIIICDLVEIYKTGFNKFKFFGLLYKLLSSIAGFLLACFWMANDTRKWFYFVDVQKYWHRTWQLPHFPLTTIQANRVLGLDTVAFVFGLLAFFICCILALSIVRRTLSKSSKLNFVIESHVLFAALYLVGVTIIDVCFTNRIGNSTNIWSLNRHLMCTAFWVVFVIFIYSKLKLVGNGFYYIMAALFGGFAVTDAIHYLKPSVFYCIFFVSLFGLKYYEKMKWIFIPIYICAVFLQISFYSDFLAYKWVG